MPLTAKRVSLATACLAACASAAGIAWAEPQGEPSVALLGGYAHEITDTPFPYYRFGLGARGGLSVSHLYVGASLVWHPGEPKRASGEGNSFETAFQAVYLGAEVGLNLSLRRFVVRPYSGLGWLVLRGRTTVRGVTVRDDLDTFYLAPGVVGLYRIEHYFFGLDARLVMPPSESIEDRAAGGMAVAGMAF